MTHEDKYRQQAKVFLRRMTEAKLFFDKHKPSVGFVGEYLLRKFLHALLSNDYGICQGFVIYGKEISRQCDIIIFKKGEDSISKSYGELKIVNAEKVVAVIEVKSSIKKDTFFSTLKAFEELHTLRVTNCFLFVYGQLSRGKCTIGLSIIVPTQAQNNTLLRILICMIGRTSIGSQILYWLLIQTGLATPTILDKPKSRNQKYVLTEAGRQLIKDCAAK